MVVYSLFLQILLTSMAVSAQYDIPFNITGLSEIYVQHDNSNSRHHRPTGSSCNRKNFLSPGNSCVFTSPGYPSPYPRGRSYFFFKSLDRTCNIQIECNSFDLPSPSVCNRLVTNLFMKWGRGLNEWKWFCGSNIPSTVVSSGSGAFAKFSSNQWRNRSFRGFNCTASAICPTTTIPVTTMTSPLDATTAPPTTATLITTALTTAAPTTAVPTTSALITTAAPATVTPITADATTTAIPTTVAPTTAAPTTVTSSTVVPSMSASTTDAQTTVAPTTAASTTTGPTISAGSTI